MTTAIRTLLLPPLLLCALTSQVASSETVYIRTTDDYYAIQQSINAKEFDFANTISLEADLDFSNFTEILEPIGSKASPFRGTFLGNNHTIRNFAMHVVTYEHAGFFGSASDGATIRDLVLDATCSVISAWQRSANAYVGGILGYSSVTALSAEGCIVANCVNMGKVTYAGNATNLYIGGIVGYATVLAVECDVTDCVNGGALSSVLSTSKNVYMGGIMGTAFSNFKNPRNVTIERCLSLGAYAAKNTKTTGAILGRSTGNNTVRDCAYNSSAFPRHAGTSNYVGTKFANMMGFEDNYTLASDANATLGAALTALAQEGKFAELAALVFTKHRMSFVTNGGHGIEPGTTFPIMSGDAVPEAERYFYVFDGWTLDKEGRVPLSKRVVCDMDVVVYAQWKFMWQMFGMIFDIFFVVVFGLIFIYDVINPHFYF